MLQQRARTVLVSAWLALAVTAASGCSKTPTAPSDTTTANAPPEPSLPASDAPPRNFKIVGRDDAPVAIIEFTDMQCPYCAQFARETFPKLRAKYIDTGRVRFGSTDTPLEMHPFAVPAAVAARCAGEQGHYWDYRDRVFENQNELGNSPYSSLAAQLGLDLQRFEACRIDGRQLQAVQQDKARATAAGIDSTPTFVIGHVVNGQFEGEKLVGSQPIEVFAQKIDALLATH